MRGKGLRDRQDYNLNSWIKIIGCPYCQGPLNLIERSKLYCRQDSMTFLFKHKILLLIKKENEEKFKKFSLSYCKQRIKQGWRPLTPDQALRVPFESPKGYPRVYWEVQKKGYLQLLHFLKNNGLFPHTGLVADLGAGSGWLSYRLARAGYQVIALDINLEKSFGLGAIGGYLDLVENRLLPVQGNFENPPLLKRKFSVILFNASLHYSTDLIKTISCAERLIKADGCIIILSSPVIIRKKQIYGQEKYQLDRNELQQSIFAAGLQQQWINIKFGLYWKIYTIHTLIRGKTCFSFPFIVCSLK